MCYVSKPQCCKRWTHKCLISNSFNTCLKYKNNLKPVTCHYRLPTRPAWSRHISFPEEKELITYILFSVIHQECKTPMPYPRHYESMYYNLQGHSSWTHTICTYSQWTLYLLGTQTHPHTLICSVMMNECQWTLPWLWCCIGSIPLWDSSISWNHHLLPNGNQSRWC